MFGRVRQRYARAEIAWRAAYGGQEPEIRDELRNVGLSALVPLVRAAEQAATTALTLAITALVGISDFVPMSTPTWSSGQARLALTGWAGASVFALLNLVAAFVQAERLEKLGTDSRIVGAHLDTCVWLAQPSLFVGMFGISLLVALGVSYTLAGGANVGSFWLTSMPSLLAIVLVLVMHRKARRGRKQINDAFMNALQSSERTEPEAEPTPDTSG